jgi:hypothetical protein
MNDKNNIPTGIYSIEEIHEALEDAKFRRILAERFKKAELELISKATEWVYGLAEGDEKK